MSDRPIEVSKSAVHRPDGSRTETTFVKFGEVNPTTGGRRSAEFRELDLVDEWNLAEVTPATAGRNWRALSLVAMSLTSLDGAPLPPLREPPERNEIRQRLMRLGDAGFAAVMEAQTPPNTDASDNADPEAAHRAHVGNLPEAAASAS